MRTWVCVRAHVTGSPVDRECSRSTAALSAGPASPLRSALVSYPVGSSGTERDLNLSVSQPGSACSSENKNPATCSQFHSFRKKNRATKSTTKFHICVSIGIHSGQNQLSKFIVPRREDVCKACTGPHLDVLGPVHLIPLLLQLLQDALQRALHRGLGHLLLRRLLLQLRAETLGQRVAALAGQRRQVLFGLQQLVFWWETPW